MSFLCSRTALLALLAVCLTLLSSSTTMAQSPSRSPSSAPTQEEDQDIPDNCSANTGCNDCVDAGCAWGIGTCFDSCDSLPELPCYARSASVFGSANTATAICQQQQSEAKDAAQCGIQQDCESCTSTRLSSTTSSSSSSSTREEGTPTTCSWYEDQQKCASTPCDSSGSCASPYCPGSPEGQCYFGATNCLDCLNLQVSSAGGFGSTTSSSGNCVWSGGKCDLECLADAICYAEDDDERSEELEDLTTIQDICEAATAEEADQELCAAQSDNGCAACTSTRQSDDSPCQYYFDIKTQTEWCGTGGCDENGVCGRESCDGVPDNLGDVLCQALEGQDRITCAQCLNADCGWTGQGTCLSTCDVLEDDDMCWDSDSGSSSTSTTTSICADAEDAIADEEKCSEIETCDICTATTKSDRRSTCEWYTDDVADESWCGTGGRDENGILGSVRCEDDGTRGGCSTQNSCSTCLEEDQCVWVGQTCQVSCNAFPNDQCFSTISRPGASVSAICNDAALDAANQDSGAAATAGVAMMSMVVAGLVALLI